MRRLALALLAACGETVAPAPAARVEVVVQPPLVQPDAPPPADREHARALLRDACGACHIGGSSEQPAALGVFDLNEPDFAARMTDEQLEAMPERIDSMALDPEVAAGILAYVSVVFADRHHCA